MKRWIVLLMMIALTGTAYADGGRVRLQQASGDFVITLFTSPEPLTTGEADFSVLVQDRSTQQVVLDALVDLELRSPSGEAETSFLTHGGASNKILQGATVRLPRTGTWRATVMVHRGAEKAACSTSFDVAASHSRRTLVLIFLILPLLVIALFLVHQAQRFRQASPLRQDR
ncbi:MAG TPA: hypothetical protein VM554_13545 [Acidisarcina sp.]|nr:hypothetical protein [Acidisarcina sp.]